MRSTKPPWRAISVLTRFANVTADSSSYRKIERWGERGRENFKPVTHEQVFLDNICLCCVYEQINK